MPYVTFPAKLVLSGIYSIPANPVSTGVMSKTAITSPEFAPPVGPFSGSQNRWFPLLAADRSPKNPATGKVVEGGIVPEMERGKEAS